MLKIVSFVLFSSQKGDFIDALMVMKPRPVRKVSLFLFVCIAVFFSGCQSGTQGESQEQRVDTLIDNVKLENEEQQMEATDGDLYEPGLFSTDPTYPGASQ